MKLTRLVSIATFVTVFSLLYVYQQTEIYRLAYLGQKQQSIVDEMIDKNSILRYTISKNASLVSIGNSICASSEFQIPESYRLVKVADQQRKGVVGAGSSNQQTFVSRVFGIKRQAEAKTINP